jgi:parallel beta-helix repeat protein
MKKVFLFALAFLVCQLSYGRIIYVSSTLGNDTRTITQAQSSSTPWASLSKVQSSMSSIVSGDSVLFRSGDRFNGTLVVSSKTNVYFGSYGTGAKPLFWGTGATISSLVILRNSKNIVVDNWNISDTTISFTDRYVMAKIKIAFMMDQSSTGNTVKNCRMDRIGYGFYLTSSSTGNNITGCDIGNLRMIKNTPKTINPDDDYGGVPVQISSSGNTFTNNYLHDCWAMSYDYGRDGGGIEFFEEGAVIENNFIAYNTFYDNNGTLEHGSNADGIANNDIRNNTFAFNKVINCGSSVYINNGGQYKTRVRNLMIYNNVFVETTPRTSTAVFGQKSADTIPNVIVAKNNIFKLTNGLQVARTSLTTPANQFVHTNNLFQLSGGSITNFTLDRSEINSTSTIWMNTVSANPLLWDYHLAPGSPAASTGTDVGLSRNFENNPVVFPYNMGIY